MLNNQQNIILIVDDNPTNIKVLFHFLKESGFKVLVAGDGESALEKLTQIGPDLILLDVMMPGIDGFETCKRIKINPKTKDIPVIFMTALSEVEDKVNGLECGAVDYITKPFQQEEVLSRVRLHLKLRNMSVALAQQNQQLKSEIEGRILAEKQLLQLNESLEEKVTQRTEALSIALSELREKEKELEYKAYNDSLTRLPNRHWFMSRLEEVVGRGKNSLNPHFLYAVLFIDLDRFKVVNDSLGHLIGDELLKLVGERLKNLLPCNGSISRLGGDEFIVLLEDIKSREEAVELANKIITHIQESFLVGNYEIYTKASIGITVSNHSYRNPIEVLRDADVALYQAKAKGKNCYVILDENIRHQALTKLELENDLRRAISQNEFELHYQPIISLVRNKLSGFEALIRWNHPQKGLISPGVFIPLAEETGLIKALDELALHSACKQIEIWHKQFKPNYDLFVNVNLSPLQLQKSNIAQQIDEVIQKYKIPLHSLKLEITESGFLDNSGLELDILHQLQGKGIYLCIDDFGTGYSSLSRLFMLPVKTLKIDKCFVDRINDTTGGMSIIKTIITLAHSLGMDVVAEGVEDQEQLYKLKALGCDFGQGYLFSKPLTSQKASLLLTRFFQSQEKKILALN
jgi:diguanylate cyclase (GGDEF)-like protein